MENEDKEFFSKYNDKLAKQKKAPKDRNTGGRALEIRKEKQTLGKDR